VTYSAAIDLPHYRCHKVVGAAKIVSVRRDSSPPVGDALTWEIALNVAGTELKVHVDAWWVAKNQPQIGGYFVRYEDGYESFSPAQPFEDGYTKVMPEPAQVVPQRSAVTHLSEEQQRAVEWAEKERLTRDRPRQPLAVPGLPEAGELHS
jgi:hypothetical protein